MSSSCCSCLSERHFSLLHPLGFPFHLTHPQSVHPRSVTLSLCLCSRKPSQQGRDRLLVPSQGRSTGVMVPSLLACCILLSLDEGTGFGQRLDEGVEEPLTPCSPFSLPGFCSRDGRFLASSSSEGRRHLVAFPAHRVNQETSWPCCEMPVPGAVGWEGVLLEQPVAAGRSGCGGGRSRVRTVQRWAGK